MTCTERYKEQEIKNPSQMKSIAAASDRNGVHEE